MALIIMEKPFTRYYVWEKTKVYGLRQLGYTEGYSTFDEAEKQVKSLTEAWDNAVKYLRIENREKSCPFYILEAKVIATY